VAVSDLGEQLFVMLSHHQAQVIDARRRWWSRRLSLRDLAMDVPTDDEWDGLTNRSSFPEHVQARQVLGIKTQLDASADERWIDGVAIASQRDRRGAGDAAHHRPAEGLTEQGWLDGRQRTLAGETGNRRLARLGVLTRVAHL